MGEEVYTPGSDINETQLLRRSKQLLDILLKDHTTGTNIKWGTDSYINHGSSFRDDQEITASLITGWYDGFIRPRAEKNRDVQLERQRSKAEVFTPSWVVKLQVDAALEDMLDLPLVEFLQTKWIEITCGEAPYMANRYDMNTGNVIPLDNRAGFIDAKFKRLNQEVQAEDEWEKFALEIYKASYGYEYQGDSLLLARENLMLTFVDNYFYMFGAFPDNKLILEVLNVVSLNVFQMDGLTYEVPHSSGGAAGFSIQLDLFEEVSEDVEEPKKATLKCWDSGKVIEFKDIVEGVGKAMKFDVAIGNPPFDERIEGTSGKQLFPDFMDASYKIARKSILITPGKFLFNAGKTSKKWNEKMLSDEHLKVLYYNPNARDVFDNTGFEGGVAITVRDEDKIYGAIESFVRFNELQGILRKTSADLNSSNLTNIAYASTIYKFTNQMHEDYPQARSLLSKGHDYDVTTNIFDKLSFIFFEDLPNDGFDYIQILGRLNTGKRVYKWVRKVYIVAPPNLNKYKVMVPKSNGSPSLDDNVKTSMIGAPLLIGPGIGHTQTFMSFGCFDTETEARALFKYIKTKFTRVLLGVLKVTQHNPISAWSKIPLQDFSSESDLDWSKSIDDIDTQLYKKYNLSQQEITFIENKIEVME